MFRNINFEVRMIKLTAFRKRHPKSLVRGMIGHFNFCPQRADTCLIQRVL